MITSTMPVREVRDFTHLHHAFSNYRNSARWLFRGQGDVAWELVPTAGRPAFGRWDDLLLLEFWKRQATALTRRRPRNNWEWLAVAQHHGFATRLLDWSFNPLAATYFAVSGSEATDCVVYAYYGSRFADWEGSSPADIKGIAVYRPTAIVDRIVRQGGVFTIHGPANLALEQNPNPDDKLEAIVIPAAHRRELLHDLAHYQIHALSLFPDLEGLSRYMNWVWQNPRSSDSALDATAGAAATSVQADPFVGTSVFLGRNPPDGIPQG